MRLLARTPQAPDDDSPVGLSAAGVRVVRGGAVLLDGVDVEVRPGELLALVGPNGAGKSTLVGVLSGDVRPDAGEVTLAGRALGGWSVRESAMRRAVLLQQVTLSFPFTVAEVLAMGRSIWAGTPAEDDDEAAVAYGVAATDVGHLLGRAFPSLSGGERARVALARVLAQRTGALLLDEPTAALDLHHQELVLGVARRRAQEGGAVAVVVHDLGLAAAYAHRVVVLARGKVVAEGPPADVFTAGLLSEVYGHAIEVIPHPVTDVPLVLPVRSAAPEVERGGAGAETGRLDDVARPGEPLPHA